MSLILLASLLILAAGPALAQTAVAPPAKEPPPQVDPVTTIVRIDTNHDGAASREEWVAYGNHDAGFTAIDTDHDAASPSPNCAPSAPRPPRTTRTGPGSRPRIRRSILPSPS